MGPGQLSYQRYDNLFIRKGFGKLDHPPQIFFAEPTPKLSPQLSRHCGDNLLTAVARAHDSRGRDTRGRWLNNLQARPGVGRIIGKTGKRSQSDTTMRKKLLFLLALAMLLLAAGFVAYRLTVPRHNITKAQIKVGMTEVEVEEILGGPFGKYNSREVFVCTRSSGSFGYFSSSLNRNDLHHVFEFEIEGKQRSAESKTWIGDDIGIQIYFNDGKVNSWHEVLVLYNDESFIEKLRRWLGW